MPQEMLLVSFGYRMHSCELVVWGMAMALSPERDGFLLIRIMVSIFSLMIRPVLFMSLRGEAHKVAKYNTQSRTSNLYQHKKLRTKAVFQIKTSMNKFRNCSYPLFFMTGKHLFCLICRALMIEGWTSCLVLSSVLNWFILNLNFLNCIGTYNLCLTYEFFTVNFIPKRYHIIFLSAGSLFLLVHKPLFKNT